MCDKLFKLLYPDGGEVHSYGEIKAVMMNLGYTPRQIAGSVSAASRYFGLTLANCSRRGNAIWVR